MLVEKTRELYDKKYDLNCAECILKAANECYDLNLSNQTIKAMAAFGGGMAIESVCGGATGAIAAIGIMFTEERGHKSPHVKIMTSEFMNMFKDNLGTLNCDELKLKYRENEDDRCLYMMLVAAKTLEQVVEKYKNEYEIIRCK
ncbi:C-GCAxxG-C-C family (seleno)protein [Clostridium septicum]|uniref:C-GCAxxG-C-C family protein n=1 Tax=Clostridium septicum TaxID=1504 RepID=A0A9N7JM05_CLOSE|nr:C-GCAxxG-C-C family (seleno)protein [Clostridium septicum]AYE34654.1 hypothetical protein CP523_09580 [Clostridium septicum]MDU1315029.1 C-GCAxxG-C-C family (seleno)protein [Clostridium septicum]QAS60053.1 hypothetical protein EI377_04325 [Clostridium septicum]UEC20704.1 C-GCAxxG-C-C family protein [Clostridium septicum]USS01245.1 C-GCAxxG-C-C family protein [Clostridium septicum]